jgi:ligand-binding sensor domain-containing protein
MRARIKCISDPESANIFINDSLIEAKTPHTINNLMPGQYTIRYSLDEHRDRSRSVMAQSNLESLAFLKLQDTSLWVDYRTDTSPIPEDYLNCLDVDSSGVIWVGTSSYGIVSYNDRTKEWQNFNSDNSLLPDNYVKDIVVDKNSNLWIATNAGLAYKDGDLWEIYNESNSILETNQINVISIDYNDRLWVGTNNGFYSKDEVGWRRHNSGRVQEPFSYINSISFDTKGETWVGTFFAGIGRSVPGGWTIYTNNSEDLIGGGGVYDYEPLPSQSISASVVEVDGERIWFGHVPNQTGPGGVSTYNQVTEKWSFNSVYVPSPVINSFYYGPNKYVWICSDRGVVKWKYGYEVIFLNEDIRELSVDKEKNLVWLASQGKGLIKYKGN